MNFKQYENGSCDILFSKQEAEFISEKQFIHLSEEALKHFGNHLVHIVSEWQTNFSDEVKSLLTNKDTEVITTIKNKNI